MAWTRSACASCPAPRGRATCGCCPPGCPRTTPALFEACLTADRPGFRVIFGVSANTRGGWVSLAEAEALGYQPQDDAEAYAAEILARARDDDPAADPVLRYLGGEFTLPDAQVPQA